MLLLKNVTPWLTNIMDDTCVRKIQTPKHHSQFRNEVRVPFCKALDIGHIQHLKRTPSQRFFFNGYFLNYLKSQTLSNVPIYWVRHSREDIVAPVFLTHFEGFNICLNAIPLRNILRFHSDVIAEVGQPVRFRLVKSEYALAELGKVRLINSE